jgi:hypothetical protein
LGIDPVMPARCPQCGGTRWQCYELSQARSTVRAEIPHKWQAALGF